MAAAGSPTAALIRHVTGVSPTLFRPPYGKYNAAVIRAAADLGYRIVVWSVDSLDWESLTAERILSNVTPGIKPGAIILMHSASGGPTEVLTGTVQALPRIIERARAAGLRPVTVSELLAAGSAAAGLPPPRHARLSATAW